MADNSGEIKEALVKFEKALRSLEKAISVPVDKELFMVDTVIQRFEFSVELAWKSMKKMLYGIENIEANTPKQVLQQAYLSKWLDDQEVWIEMLKDRNLSSHTYKESLAKEIYSKIKNEYFSVLNEALDKLKNIARSV